MKTEGDMRNKQARRFGMRRARSHWAVCLHEAGHVAVVEWFRQRATKAVVYSRATNGRRGYTNWDGDPELHVRAAIAVAGVAAQEMWGSNTERRLLEATLGDWEPLVQACNGNRQQAETLWLSQKAFVRRLFSETQVLEMQVKAVAKELSLRGMLDEFDILRLIREYLHRGPDACER